MAKNIATQLKGTKMVHRNFLKKSVTHLKGLVHNYFRDFDLWVTEKFHTSILSQFFFFTKSWILFIFIFLLIFPTFYKKTIYIEILILQLLLFFI